MTAEAPEREAVARAALAEITPAGDVGELTSSTTSEDGVVTLTFAALMPGYPGWHWTVSLAELPDEAPSVLEAELLPGEGALLAPDWVPWAVRLEEYRAAQAAAGEPDETLTAGDAEAADADEDDADDDDDDDDSDEDDDESDEDADLEDADDEDDDLDTDDEDALDLDESDDVIDFESDDDSDDDDAADSDAETDANDDLDDHFEPGSAER